MICRIRLTLIVCFLLAAPVLGQDMSRTVLPITQLKWIGPGVEAKFGTGFCLDAECRLIGTNYHVAVMTRPRKIKGQKIIQRYLATGPDDEGATLNGVFFMHPLKYNISRDLAIYELRRPLRNCHGIPFSLSDLPVGLEVDIYAYPKGAINPIRSLMRFHGSFKGETTDGLLAFDYVLSNGKRIRAGASGGLIVDSKTRQIIGILNGVAANREQVALAVPIQALADFVASVQPWVAQSIFLSSKYASPVFADIYPKFVWPHEDSPQHRAEESHEVKLLRQKAQLLTNSIRNFIAVQSFEFGSRGNAPTAADQYEVQVIDGFQRFRDPETEEEFRDMPFPPRLNTAIGTGGEWSELPAMVGTDLGLKIHQFPDATINGRTMRVFQYRAAVEDGVPCNFFRIIRDYGLFERSRILTAPCYGEVWTDQDTNIERISEHIELPENLDKWKDNGTVVTYGWLRRNAVAPRIIPLTISTEAEYRKKVYWCRGTFTNYRVFGTQTRIVANEQKPATDARPGLPQ